MFERYSEKARRVIFFARYEASELGSPTIETDHLLLGIVRESREVLRSLLLSALVDAIGERIRQRVPVRNKIPTSVDLPFGESAKRALHSAMEEADKSGKRIISTQHILLGMLRQEDSLAREILSEMGVSYETACGKVGDLPDEKADAPESYSSGGVTGRALPNEEFQRAVIEAIEEANLLRSTSARPEHLLLGLLRNEGSLAAKILREAGLDLAGVRRKLEGA